MRLARTLLPASLLAILFWTLLSGAAHAQDPDFSDTPDILHGQNYFLQNDDIVVVQANQPLPANQPGETNTYLYEMLTANGAITSVQAITATVPMTPAPIANEAGTAVGRMFDLPNDVVAVLAMDGSAPAGTFPLNLTIRDPKTGNTIKQPIANLSFGGLDLSSLLMADFTGDGYDDLAVNYSDLDNNFVSTVQIVQATNPLSFTAGLKVGPAYTSDTFASSLAAARLGGRQGAHLLLTTQVLLVVLNVDPHSLALTVQSGVVVPGANGNLAVVAGNFDGDPDDEEAVVLNGDANPNHKLYALLYDFPAPQLSPVLLDTADTGPQVLASGAVAGGCLTNVRGVAMAGKSTHGRILQVTH